MNKKMPHYFTAGGRGVIMEIFKDVLFLILAITLFVFLYANIIHIFDMTK